MRVNLGALTRAAATLPALRRADRDAGTSRRGRLRAASAAHTKAPSEFPQRGPGFSERACRDSNAGPLASEGAILIAQSLQPVAIANQNSLGAPLALARSENISPVFTHPALTSERLLTVHEVAGQLNICAATVYGLCSRGELAHTRLLHNSIRIAPADLEAFLVTRRRIAPPPRRRRSRATAGAQDHFPPELPPTPKPS
jgi:excisionase family DNA binding protein